MEDFKISVTPINLGVSFSITQASGEMDTSQSVKAYSALMAISADMPGPNCTSISTSFAVLSMTLFTLNLPLSLAFKILSINDPVVVPKGISLINKVLLSFSSIFALTRILLPFRPSLYWLKSALPPVGKSGNSSIFFPFKMDILASQSSIKL